MELHELRARWQQSLAPPAAPTPPDEAALRALLARRSAGLVEKMWRNAWLETGFTALVALALPFYIAARPEALHRLYGGAALLLSLVMLYYFYRKLRLLGRMAHTEAHVRNHLTTLCAGLRQLLRFYYRLTLAAGPYSLLLGLSFFVGQELARPGDFRWSLMGGMAAAFLAFGAVLQVGMVYGTRWYLQRLYGQHLDRLEQSLAELDEPVADLSC